MNNLQIIRTLSASGASARIPSIKFRARSGNVQTTSTQGSQIQGFKVSQGPVIEDHQLPSRYRRRPISDEEVEIINRGGV